MVAKGKVIVMGEHFDVLFNGLSLADCLTSIGYSSNRTVMYTIDTHSRPHVYAVQISNRDAFTHIQCTTVHFGAP